MGLFGRKNKSVSVPTEPQTTLIEVRSMTGFSYHIVDTATPADRLMDIPALCGYTQWLETNTPRPVTAESIRNSLPRQHEGWHWCAGCIDKVLSPAA